MPTITNIVETAGSVVTLTVSSGYTFVAGNVVQLWGLTTGWWLNGRLVTLLTGTTNTSLVFADPTVNGPQPSVAETGKATVYTPQTPAPDELYLQPRENLLPYEDARFNSLIQGVANFYMTRNDQSTWGNCLRAIAMELSRFEYFYAYDLINKVPSYLTPPDIRRRWADPLYVSSYWPSPTQFDLNFKTMLVDLIAAYRMGSTAVGIQDVIFAYTGINIVVEQLYQFIGDGFYDQSDRNAIKVAVNVGGTNSLQSLTSLIQLQAIIQSLYGAIDLAKAAHVGLEFTTVFGEGEDLDCLISPMYVTQQQYDTMSATSQAYYNLNGYVTINPVLFWQPLTSFVNPNQANKLGLVITDSNGNLQMVTAITGNGLSGASRPVWNLTAGGITVDGNVTWTNISSAVTSVEIISNPSVSNLLVVNVANTPLPITPAPNTIRFVELVNSQFLNGQKLTVLSATPTGFTATYVNNAYVTNVQITGTTLTVLCANNFQPGMTIEFSGLLDATFLNEQSVVVDTILYGGSPVAPIGFTATFSHGSPPTNYPSTADSGTAAVIEYPLTTETFGTVAYFPAASISIAEYQSLSAQFQTLYQAQYVNNCCPDYLSGPLNPEKCSPVPVGITDTLRIIIREIEQPPFDPMLIQAPVLGRSAMVGVLNPAELAEWDAEVKNTLFGHEPTTTLAAWGYRLTLPPDLQPKGFPQAVVTTGKTLTPAQWAALPQITFTITNVVSDGKNATYTYTNLMSVAAGSPSTVILPPELQLHEGELVTISGCSFAGSPPADLLNGTAKINDVTSTTFSIPNPHVIASTPQSASGNVAPLLQSAWTLQYGNYQLLVSPPPSLPPYLGVSPVLSPPSNWIEIVANIATVPNEVNLVVTGEVANWDQTHLMGLLAPRLNQVWEISGGDQYFIFQET
jgi:hypothetical protein